MKPNAARLAATLLLVGSSACSGSSTAPDAAVIHVPDAAVPRAPDAATPDAAVAPRPDAAMPVDQATLACEAAFSPDGGASRNFRSILDACPRLAERIVWTDGANEDHAWNTWDKTRKDRVQEFYTALLHGQLPQVNCPDPHDSAQHPEAEWPTIPDTLYFRAAEAFDVFAYHVAHAFHLQAAQRVPWSLARYSNGQLSILLGSRENAVPIRVSEQSNWLPAHILPGRDLQLPDTLLPVTVCDLQAGVDLMTGARSASHQLLLGGSVEETLVLLTSWFALNLGHGGDPLERQWVHYRFSLEGRLRAAPAFSMTSRALAPTGCHSAAKLFSDLARSVNIPVLHVRSMESPVVGVAAFRNRTHAGLVYAHDGDHPRMAWHTDDLYAMPDRPHLPLNGSGVPIPVGSAEARQRFFESVWVPLQRLDAWGFSVATGFPTVVPAVGVGGETANPYESYFDYGPYGGAWKFSSTDGASATYSALLNRYYHERQFEECGRDLMHNHCHYLDDPESFESYINNVLGASLVAPELPVQRTAADYRTRIQACVDARGGCAAVTAEHDAWDGLSGSGVFE